MKYQVSKNFNPQMLALARESRGLTQTELARKLKTTQGRISKMEAGVADPPTKEYVGKLARILDYPPAFFAQPEQLLGIPISYYRKRQSVGKKILQKINAEMNIRRIHLSKLLAAADIESDYSVPQLDIDEFDGDGAEVARSVKLLWQIPSGPIKNLIGVVEQAGCIVIPMDFPDKKIDAISQRAPGLPPIVFVSNSIPTDRLRFSLAHELGHLVMHFLGPTPNMEREADAFAAEFLMPADAIAKDMPKPVRLERIAALKPIWRVSMAALLMRAMDLGKVTKKMYQYYWTIMGKNGWRRREPPELDLSPEEPRLLRDLVKYHLKELGYSMEELASALCDKESEFQSRYEWPKRPMRLVVTN